ncbi:40S ribosomal protein S29-like [Acomys russatus]|uniref:40S ribosomal protein S29-like n=1 Tax=Acomys russatus TaxID=60746 RepID=UPI0021E2AB88|nr:40S ribosomal protein S29-like [Acomys russatus]
MEQLVAQREERPDRSGNAVRMCYHGPDQLSDHQQLYWSHPRKFGQGSRSCRACSNRQGLIQKYGLNMCRQCFHQYTKGIGFIKLD